MPLSLSNNLTILQNIRDVPATDWNACVEPDNPFARHEFLSALEESGCVNAENGWQPHHFVLSDEELKTPLVCAPTYLKGHSYGEYVFDWSWADAYERAGGRYYPKMQCAIPFTPVSGCRLLSHPHAQEDHKRLILQAMMEQVKELGLSSLHITFSKKDEWDLMQREGLMARTGHQYHWENKGFKTFDDFLALMSSRKRKTIKKERRSMSEGDLSFQVLSGKDILEEHWDRFYEFYLDTSGRKWGHPYLNRTFYSLLGEKMSKNVVLVLALSQDKIVAGALNLKGSETLYGRYWGCREDFKFLHFETCYYQAIDYAIQHKLQRVEAGAQGQHKIQRGYLPVETYSAHYIPHNGFERAVKDFLAHDRKVNDLEMQELSSLSPFKL